MKELNACRQNLCDDNGDIINQQLMRHLTQNGGFVSFYFSARRVN